ncbi:MAG TPA: helix-turn-helix domain-containing protein [Tepidisphaeraceae bacterium]|nr:helix-turn-helix domain-containing protein [Tepidisphaeraceae bacterium]
MAQPHLLNHRLLGANIFLPGHAPVRATRTIINGATPMDDRDCMDIFLVVSGTGTHRTIYGDQTLARGDAYILRPGAWHSYQNAKSLELLQCRFGLELLQHELAWTRNDPAMELMFWAAPLSLDRRGLLHVPLTGATLDRCQALLEELVVLTSPGSAGLRAEEIGRLLLFLSEMGREVAASLLKLRRGKPEPHQAVTEGIRLMEEDIRRDWTLPELAKRLKLDKSYLVRLFRAHTGSPPMQFLTRLRAERAAMLLLRTQRDIGIIGGQVGWNDPNYFARRFRAHFGVSATNYRRQFAEELSA